MSTRLFHRPGDGADIRDIGGEFHDNGFVRLPQDPFRHRCSNSRIRTKSHSTLFHVGTADVDLKGGNAGYPLEARCHSAVLIQGVSIDVHNNTGIQFLEPRQFFQQENFQAHIGQPNGIQHAAGRLHDAGRWVARHGFQRDPLDHNAPQKAGVHNGRIFLSIAKGSGRGENRIFEAESAHLNRQIRVVHG